MQENVSTYQTEQDIFSTEEESSIPPPDEESAGEESSTVPLPPEVPPELPSLVRRSTREVRRPQRLIEEMN